MSQSTGRSPASATAAGTEKQVNAGKTTSRRGDIDLSALRVSVNAAVPDETAQAWRIPKCDRMSASRARRVATGEQAPATACRKSVQHKGAAAGGMVRPILMAISDPLPSVDVERIHIDPSTLRTRVLLARHFDGEGVAPRGQVRGAEQDPL